MNETDSPVPPAPQGGVPEPVVSHAAESSTADSTSPPPRVPRAPEGGGEDAGAGRAGGVADASTAGREAGDGEGGDGPADPGAGGGERRRRRRRRRRKAGDRTDADGGEAGPAGESADDATAPAATAAPAQQAVRESRRKERERNRDANRGPRTDRNERHDRRGGRDSQHSAMIAVRALADMAQSLLRVEGVDALAMPRYLDLNLRVPMDGGNDLRHAAGTAVEQILARVREVREHEQALRPGAVYSYFAGTAHAEGCRPTEPRHVFDGFSSTGKPTFSDFVTLAIERKDPDIERLLAGEEIVLTHVTLGRVLRTQQLAEFGGQSPVFKILGQVNAGLFRTLGAASRCAFSFQLLRGTTLEGRVRLRLHAVGAVDPMDLADPALMQILSRFQRRLDGEALRLEGQIKNGGGEFDEESFVLPLLQDFARQLQGRTRSAGRRTQHGNERAETNQRPTSRAYPDAGEASDSAILWDVDQGTVVVLGAKGRVHVFTPAGKHVTSVMMQGAAIERRRHQGRWRLAEPEERGEFRIQVKRLIAAGQDQPREEDVGPLPGQDVGPGGAGSGA